MSAGGAEIRFEDIAKRYGAVDALHPTSLTIEAGEFFNILPQKGRAVLNVRILPGDSVAGILDHIRQVAEPNKVEVHVIGSDPAEPSRISSTESPAFRNLQKSIAEVFPNVVSAPALLVGRTDSHLYERVTKDSYRFLPSRLSSEDVARIHGTDERISVENYGEIVRFYIRLIKNTAIN